VIENPNYGRNNLYELLMHVDGQGKHFVSVLDPFSRAHIREQAIIGELAANHRDPDSFLPNPVFIKYLHQCTEWFGPRSPALRAEAERQTNWNYYGH
jgi:hypothetical protein